MQFVRILVNIEIVLGSFTNYGIILHLDIPSKEWHAIFVLPYTELFTYLRGWWFCVLRLSFSLRTIGHSVRSCYLSPLCHCMSKCHQLTVTENMTPNHLDLNTDVCNFVSGIHVHPLRNVVESSVHIYGE